jgi:hypothetical protein
MSHGRSKYRSEYLENWKFMEQVTEYNNVTREVKIQVRILREL